MEIAIGRAEPHDEPHDEPEDNGWSEAEKGMIAAFTQKAGQLPWPLKTIELGNGCHEQVYDIPEDKMYDAVVQCWPFTDDSIPPRGGELFDIHEHKRVVIDKCLILRFKERNIVVSPYYAKSGGTVIDLVHYDDKSHEPGELIVYKSELK